MLATSQGLSTDIDFMFDISNEIKDLIALFPRERSIHSNHFYHRTEEKEFIFLSFRLHTIIFFVGNLIPVILKKKIYIAVRAMVSSERNNV